MIFRILSVCACSLFLVLSAFGDIPFAGVKVHFASQAEGRQLLVTKDDFIRRLSDFDRSARMKVDRAVSEAEFLDFVGRNALPWTEDEISSVERVLKDVQPLIGSLTLPLPGTIQIIKTSGAEEGNAAYTRGSAIILPKNELAKGKDELARLICHELFHVMSRKSPELREQLYAVIGFKKCDEVALPADMLRRKITNPDAPLNDHSISVKIEDEERAAVPVLLSVVDQYDAKRGGEFFEYLQLHFLVLEKVGEIGKPKPAALHKAPQLVDLKRVSGFMEQVGQNTSYIIHPEEILAENFAMLVLQQGNVRSPEILQKMKQVLSK